MSASANLVQSNVTAFNSGDNFMLISNSEDNTKKFKNFQSNEIKRIKQLSESMNEICDDSSKDNVSALKSNNMYQEIDSDNDNAVVEKKYQVGSVNNKVVQFQDNYQEIGAPLEVIDNEEASVEENNSEVDNTEVVNTEVDNTEVDNTEVDNTEVDNTEVDNSDSEGLVVPNTVEEPLEEESELPEPVEQLAAEPVVVEKFTEVNKSSSTLTILLILLVVLLGLAAFYYFKDNSPKIMRSIYGVNNLSI